MGTRGKNEQSAGSAKEWQYAPVPSQGGDGRVFPRFYFRTLATAIIHPVPGVGMETQMCYVLTRDLSRNGVSFMHPKALDVGQRIEMVFQDGKEITAKVQQTRQLAPRCFLVGCRFTLVPDLDGKKLLAELNRK
jgi:hypothetical protein